MKIRLLAGCILCFSAACITVNALENNKLSEQLKQGQLNRIFSDEDFDYYKSLEKKLRTNEQMNKNALEMVNESRQKLVENNPYTAQANAIYLDKKDKVQKIMKGMNGGEFYGNADINKAHYSTLVFASLSMPESDIKEMYRSLAGDREATIVFRGLPKGTKSITQAIAKFQQIARDLNLKVTPNVVLNPVWFMQYHITEVPAIVKLTEPTPNRSGDPKKNVPVETPKEVARVLGLISPAWLNERFKEGKKGNFGRMGQVYEIEEIDLIEEMKSRASRIDWVAKQRQAFKRAWHNLLFETLEPALETRTRLIDPTITLKQDIKNKQGEVLAQAGTKVNPLHKRAFTHIYVAFDGTNKREIEFVKRNLPKWQQEHNVLKQQVVLMLTDIDRENGWQAHEELQTGFNNAVFVLQPEIKNTFKLEKHPSLVYANDDYYVVEEFRID